MNSLQKILLTFVNFQEKNAYYQIFFSKTLYDNHIYIYLYYNLSSFLPFFKNNLHNSFTSLIDLVGIDLTGLKNYNFLANLINTTYTKPINFLLIYNLIDYNTSYRYIWNSLINREDKIFSLVSVYANSNWLERELIEFFGVNIPNKLDTRNLLLDYNFIWNPLLKTFPVEGYQEIFYNFSTHTLDYISAEFIEL